MSPGNRKSLVLESQFLAVVVSYVRLSAQDACGKVITRYIYSAKKKEGVASLFLREQQLVIP